MSIGKTLVSYRHITQPFRDMQALLEQSRQAALSVTGDQAEAENLVSGLAEGLQNLQAAERDHRVMNTARHPIAAILQSSVANSANQDGKLQPLKLQGLFPFEGFEVQFSNADWFRWMLSFFTWVRKIVPHPFPQGPADPAVISNNYRIAILGDWGTGLYGAPFCSQSIQADPNGYDLLLHLGDVYYSGAEDEVQQRFLPFWPNLPTALSRALNGNHEMYTGGYAYFDIILKQFQQPASYFALQNDFWLLVGLDSAYQDHSLTDDQVEWLRRIVAGAGDRKIVLFSHHQPFSLLDQQGPNLVDKLREFLEGRKIFAWYWGHEHRCVLYDPHPVWGLCGRCVGHGGFPQSRTDLGNAPQVPGLNDGWRKLEASDNSPGGLLLDTANVYIPGFEAQFGPNGYMRLDFSGARLNESVRAADGADIFDRELTAAAGGSAAVI